MKKMALRQASYMGHLHIDLLIERDAGNEILILMGAEEYGLEAWSNLAVLCEQALDALRKG